MRGKVGAAFEFGAKIAINPENGYFILVRSLALKYLQTWLAVHDIRFQVHDFKVIRGDIVKHYIAAFTQIKF